MNPGQGRLRVWRGLLLAAASLGMPAAAHIAAGGGVPTQSPFLFGAALLGIACIALADRQRTAGAIAGVIALSQPVLHGLLALSDHGLGAVVPTPQMVLAHAVATLALTVLLAGGEAVLWSMAALAGTILGTAARVLLGWSLDAGRAYGTGTPRPVDLPLPRHLLLTAESPRRGPPVGAGA